MIVIFGQAFYGLSELFLSESFGIFCRYQEIFVSFYVEKC